MKRRTQKHGWGKHEQRLTSLALHAISNGNDDFAAACRNRIARRLRAKATARPLGRRNKTAISVGGRFAQGPRGY